MNSINATGVAATNLAPTPDKLVRSVITESVEAGSAETVKPVTKVSDAELRQAVDVVNQAVAMEQRSLSFSIDDASGRSVIKVVDFETDELIKQIPSEELLKVAQNIKRLQEEMGQSIGLLIDNKV
ncbi:flagellar protein FlaG [Arsukibacterium sp.]|uniref:flagellar protein FlaG n=1 Tax=Arsukibacterium sp. TaxID=1977258 RepID=UPI00299D7226|nr:flagellar protein FlaG [Arsukibacterium sp.]MDX1677265.1 flagellar protein FlaG [Arsukibacterium sp.]